MRLLKSRGGKQSRLEMANFVQSLPAPEKLLGLTHVTDSYLLRDIIESEKIEADEKCHVLDESVTYTFYGRAAFRGSDETIPSDLACLFPSVLIIDPARVPRPKYVFGFDSGAFMAGKFDSYLHKYMPLFDFMLVPDPTAAARLVSAVFPSADDYLNNRPAFNFEVPASNFELESYKTLVLGGGRGSNRLDDRLSTPEVIFIEPLSLRSCVRAAILPDRLASEIEIGGALRNAGIKVIPYPWTSCSRPIENHMLIRSLVRAVYEELGWL